MLENLLVGGAVGLFFSGIAGFLLKRMMDKLVRKQDERAAASSARQKKLREFDIEQRQLHLEWKKAVGIYLARLQAAVETGHHNGELKSANGAVKDIEAKMDNLETRVIVFMQSEL